MPRDCQLNDTLGPTSRCVPQPPCRPTDCPPHVYELTEDTFLLNAHETPSSDCTFYVSSMVLFVYLMLLVGSLGGTLAFAFQLSFAASYVWLVLVAIMVILHCVTLLLIKTVFILSCLL